MNDAQKVLQAEYLRGIGRGDAVPDGCDTASFSKSGWISAADDGWQLTDAGRDHLGSLSSEEAVEDAGASDGTTNVDTDAPVVGDEPSASGAVQLL